MNFIQINAFIVFSLGLFSNACSDKAGFSTGKKAKVASERDANPTEPPADEPATAALPTPEPEVESSESQLTTLSFVVSTNQSNKEADVAFFVDTSGSMREEAVSVATNMAAFVETIQKSELKGLNLIVVSDMGDIPNSFAEGNNFAHIKSRVGSHDALEITTQLISDGTISLRDHSIKEFIYVTDDDAEGTRLRDFKNFVASNSKLADKLAVSGLVWQDGVSQRSSTCTRAANGSDYMDLADNLQRKGLILDLCSEDWNKMFVQLASKIVEELTENTFSLNINSQPGSLSVELAGRVLASEEYSFDEVGKILTVNNDLIKDHVGAELKVSFLEK